MNVKRVGSKEQRRSVNGLVLLDKPSMVSSNQALRMVQRLFNSNKAGHTGSLDPLATGLLPLCFGEATKLSRFLLDADKTYQTRIQLGTHTTTGDSQGDTLETRPVEKYSRSQIEATLANFQGTIQQIPPMYSALKHQGKPLYKLAREGIEIERQARTVQIFKNQLTDHGRDWLDLEIKCSKGTYIRTIATDLGCELGCCAHVSSLRRTAIGPYSEDDMVTLETLKTAEATNGLSGLDQYLMPIASMVPDWPCVCLSTVDARLLLQGMPVTVDKSAVIMHASAGDWVRITWQRPDASAIFLGIGKMQTDGKVAPKRLIADSQFEKNIH